MGKGSEHQSGPLLVWVLMLASMKAGKIKGKTMNVKTNSVSMWLNPRERNPHKGIHFSPLPTLRSSSSRRSRLMEQLIGELASREGGEGGPCTRDLWLPFKRASNQS